MHLIAKAIFWIIFDIWKSGHFRSRSFSVIFKNDSVILLYSIYKYIFILYYRGRFAPPKRKWPKMTVTENDRIRLLKVIRKEAMDDCNMVIITKLAYVVVSACTMFCIVGTAHILLLYTPVFLLFLRESWQNRSRNSSFSLFHSAFYPLLFLPSEGVKSVIRTTFSYSKGIFLLLSLQKTIQPFLSFLLG